jgi:hypothetical protein
VVDLFIVARTRQTSLYLTDPKDASLAKKVPAGYELHRLTWDPQTTTTHKIFQGRS